jgi:hypothetical protein
VRLDSPNKFPAEPGYAEIVKNSGISRFSKGTQSTREAEALALVRKHSATDVKVNLLWGNPDNTRRADIMQLVRAAGKRAGFDVNAPGQQGWSIAKYRQDNFWDAHHYAWGKTAILQEENVGLYETVSAANYLGFSNAKIDAIYKKLGATLLTQKQRLAAYTDVEKELYSNSVTLPIVQFPEAAGVNAKLQNVKIGPLSPQVVHNYWEWRYTN